MCFHPNRIKRYVSAGSKIFDALFIGIGGSCRGFTGAPAEEGVVSSGKAVSR